MAPGAEMLLMVAVVSVVVVVVILVVTMVGENVLMINITIIAKS